jgi:Domain of Unknown Function (DUF928)
MVVIMPPFQVMRSFSSLGLITAGLIASHGSHIDIPVHALSDRFQTSQVVFAAPQLPPNQDAPRGRRQGGASRGPCLLDETLTALTPVTQGQVLGLTTRDRPTFWFYIPGRTHSDVPIQFVLQDESDEYVHQETITPSELQAGIVSFTVPETAPALEVGKTYNWTVAVSCNSAHSYTSVFVKGAVQRVAPNAELQHLTSATPLDQASLYAANGIWYDALTILATLRQANPNDLQVNHAWNDLLQQVELGSIAPSPLIACCIFSQSDRLH